MAGSEHSAAMPSGGMRHGEQPRDYARRISALGAEFLIHAFNAADNPALFYRYGPDERAELTDLLLRVVLLIERGTICPNPIVEARRDAGFRKFLARVAKPPKRRRVQDQA